MKKITACIVIVLIITLLPLAVAAQETTLTTKIPSVHTLHIEVKGEGTVTVDGVTYRQTTDVQIPRHSQPSILLKSGNAMLVTYNGDDITGFLQNGSWKMPSTTNDAHLTIMFKATGTNPQTADTTNIPLLLGMAIVSFAGLVFCQRNQRKVK